MFTQFTCNGNSNSHTSYVLVVQESNVSLRRPFWEPRTCVVVWLKVVWMMFTPFTWKFSKPHIICFGCSKEWSQWDGSFKYPLYYNWKIIDRKLRINKPTTCVVVWLKEKKMLIFFSILMPPKELRKAYSNRTVRPSRFVSGAYLLNSLR